jgi:hypothetical protein
MANEHDEFQIRMGCARLLAFGTCTELCHEKDHASKPCFLCMSKQRFRLRSMNEQPFDSIVIMPPAFFIVLMARGDPIMYHLVVALYMAVIELIEYYCDPDFEMAWHTPEWHLEHRNIRVRCQDEMRNHHREKMNLHLQHDHAGVLRALELHIFESMAVVEEVARLGSRTDIPARIQENWTKQCDSMLTVLLLQLTKGRCGKDKFEVANEMVAEWNEDRQTSLFKRQFDKVMRVLPPPPLEPPPLETIPEPLQLEPLPLEPLPEDVQLETIQLEPPPLETIPEDEQLETIPLEDVQPEPLPEDVQILPEDVQLPEDNDLQ